jgi:signal transduction histidine kinase
MPWGTHFCHFYETKKDLFDTLVPYFQAGLENQEFCLWVSSPPLTQEEARRALQQAVPDLDRYLVEQSIEILPHDEWYLKGGGLDLHGVIKRWTDTSAQALARGYAGMRFSGDGSWIQKQDWRDFLDYEKELNELLANQRLIVLCTYPLATSGAAEIFDVACIHQVAIARRNRQWEVIETPELKQAKAEIKRLNEELEQRVMVRTSQLTAAYEELQREMVERQRLEEDRNRLSQRILALQESERRALARELHDEVGQTLTGLKFSLEMALQAPPEVLRDRLLTVEMSVNDLIAKIRHMSLDLRPSMLDDLGLLPALLWLFERFTGQTGVQVDFKQFGLAGQRFGGEIDTAAYRIVQEALTNVARHAGVRQVTVRAWADNTTFGVQIEDHGSGFNRPASQLARYSSGLSGMYERARILGGQLSIDTAPGAGTRITAVLPLRRQTEGISHASDDSARR